MSARFSLRETLSACSTWKSHVFPNMVAVATPASSMPLMPRSFSGAVPGRCEAPNAASLALPSPISPAFLQNSSSRGFAPGYPPSM